MTERALIELNPRRDVIMWHVVLCIDATRSPVAVRITTNPLDHGFYAQVVMAKTRSHGCAVQLARYVRRTFEITEPVTDHRAPRAVEAMIGYACTRTEQHAPNERTPGWGVFQHMAITPISKLLEEVRGGHSTTSTRYVVYEVRCPGHPALRGVTNKYNALERRYREAPPDSFWPARAEIVVVGRYATAAEAEAQVRPLYPAGDRLWTRRPAAEYVRALLRVDGEDIVWTCDGSAAVRRYDFDAVVIGPHVYTLRQIRGVLEHGAWIDGRRA